MNNNEVDTNKYANADPSIPMVTGWNDRICPVLTP